MYFVIVDNHGKIKLPKKILEKVGSNKFIIYIRGDEIILKPLPSKSLKELFDTIEIDVPIEAFEDYDKLKKYL